MNDERVDKDRIITELRAEVKLLHNLERTHARRYVEIVKERDDLRERLMDGIDAANKEMDAIDARIDMPPDDPDGFGTYVAVDEASVITPEMFYKPFKDKPTRAFFECGICAYLHRVGWEGDCRDDSQRFEFGDLSQAELDKLITLGDGANDE